MLGETISHYKVLEKIGEGGMGEVYRATDTKLNRDVALKILPEQFASDSQRMGRFQREAEVLASLDHPNIGQIYGIEESGQTKALVLQLIEGPTLADKIAQGPIPVEDALKIALQMAEGLEAAHEKGVIHRDLKPANIKITPEGQVKILDFGLAKALEAEVPVSSLSQSPTLTNAATQAGVILGTAAYMSPEQARGKPTDRRADVWAIGVVLFEMLSGKPAFEGEDVSMVLAHVLSQEPNSEKLPAELAPGLRELLARCLRKDPTLRVQAIGDVRIALQEYLTDPSGVLVQPTGDVVQAPPRRIVPWVLAALVLGALIAGVAVRSVMSPAPPRLARFAISEPPNVFINPGSTPTVTISPDGTRIVYVGPGAQLYVRAVDQLDAVALRGGIGINPFISPDGDWVGFRGALADDSLNKVSIHGGPPVVLSEQMGGIAGASWGADGSIIFGTTLPGLGLFRVSAAGSVEREPVTTLEEGDLSHRWPEILPDNRTVLFTVEKSRIDANFEIAALNLETGERKLLIPGGSNPHYAASGHIVYGVDGTLRAVPFDLDAVEVKGDPVPVLEGVLTQDMGDVHFSLAKDGTLVYLPGTAATVQRRVPALVNRDGVVERLNVPPKEYLSPRLSPDGKTLVVQSAGENGNVIWAYDLTGDTAIQQLTFEGNNNRPIWTPDSQRITFSSDRDGTMSIYWMPADGTGVAERLTTAEEGTSHLVGSWSPGGDLLVFNVVRDLQTDWDIWTLSVDDRETQSLYDMPGTIYMGAELSPNGEWLAYGAGPNAGGVDIYVEPFRPTGARRRISQDGGYFPLWSPEGSELFYRPGVTSGARTLKSVDIVTEPVFAFSNEQTLPGEGFNVVINYRDYDMSPDGERLLMVFPADEANSGEASRPQINIVLNWFEELKERVPVP